MHVAPLTYHNNKHMWDFTHPASSFCQTGSHASVSSETEACYTSSSWLAGFKQTASLFTQTQKSCIWYTNDFICTEIGNKLKLIMFLIMPYNMIIFCNCHLNLNNFQIVCHKATSQENVMGFQIQIWLPVMKQDIISYMSTVEDTRTIFITHFGIHT